MQLHFHNSTAEHTISLLRSIGDYERLIEVLRKIVKRTEDPAVKAQKLCEIGSILFQEYHKTAEALELYQEALQCQPKNLDIISALEEIYEKEEQWEKLAEIKEEKLSFLTESSEIRELHVSLGYICELISSRNAGDQSL